MAIFSDQEINWNRIDFVAIAAQGMVTLDIARRDACRRWLDELGYQTTTIDCSGDKESLFTQISTWLRFPKLYGHEFHGSLDGLSDGLFDLEVSDDGGVVVELLRVDMMWELERDFISGFMGLLVEQSVIRMMQGQRLFAICVVPPDSPMIGQRLWETTVSPCWPAWSRDDPFVSR